MTVLAYKLAFVWAIVSLLATYAVSLFLRSAHDEEPDAGWCE